MTTPTHNKEIAKEIENLITKRLDGMPNYEEYMVNSTMKVLLTKDLVEYFSLHSSHIGEWLMGEIGNGVEIHDHYQTCWRETGRSVAGECMCGEITNFRKTTNQERSRLRSLAQRLIEGKDL